MNFSEFDKAISLPRLGKYLRASKGNKNLALRLYRYNIKLCQRFYGILSIFEVVFRNAINDHMKKQLSDPNWLATQGKKGFLSKYRNTITIEHKKLIKSKKYSNDRLLSTMSFGVWTYLFTRRCYNNSGKTLLRIFQAKPFGLNQNHIYNELNEIRIFRNRIAHHEPLCFDSNGNIDLTQSEKIQGLVLDYLSYLGYEPNKILYGIERPNSVLEKINRLKKSIESI